MSDIHLKTFPEILKEMEDIVRLNPKWANLKFLPGAMVRKILESAAIQDAEQYVQISKVLDLFDKNKCFGDDLRRRLLDFNYQIQGPKQSLTSGVFNDVSSDATMYGVVKTSLQSPVVPTGTYLIVLSTTGLPASGWILIDRDGTNPERLHYLSMTGNQLTLDPGTLFTYAHDAAAPVYLSTHPSSTSSTAVNKTFTSGTEVYAQATSVLPEISFLTLEEAVILDGDATSNTVAARSKDVGAITTVAKGVLSGVRSETNYTFNNTVEALGGSDGQSDAEAKAASDVQIQSLARSTPLAVEQSVLGLVSGNQQVLSSQIQEPIGPGVSKLFVDGGDSTGVLLDDNAVDREAPRVLLHRAYASMRRIRFGEFPIIADSDLGHISISADIGYIASVTGSAPRYTVSINTSYGGYETDQFGGDGASDDWRGWYMKDDADELFPVYQTSAYSLVVGPSINSTLANPIAPLSLSVFALVYDTKQRANMTGTGTASSNTLTVSSPAWQPGQFNFVTRESRYVWKLYDSLGNSWDIESNTDVQLALKTGSTPVSGTFTIKCAYGPLTGVDSVWLTQVGGPQNTIQGVSVFPADYVVSYEHGELELTVANWPDGLFAHACVLAWGDKDSTKLWPTAHNAASDGQIAYQVATGLVQLCQRTVNGDLNNLTQFPGWASVGTVTQIVAPTVLEPYIKIVLDFADGYSLPDLVDAVKAVIVSYVNSLRVGDTVILAEIIRRVMAITGIRDVHIVFPTENVPVLPDQVARITDLNSILVG